MPTEAEGGKARVPNGLLIEVQNKNQEMGGQEA